MAEMKMNLSYEQNSTPQKIAGDMLSDYLWSALASHTEQKLVTIADFGAATGLNSCRQFKPLLQRFRDLSSAPVLLYHTDRPENHWSVLFSNLTSSPDTYHSVPNVHSFAVGQSFYTQLFPANYLDIAYACASFHWLSQPTPNNVLALPSNFAFESNPLLLAEHHTELALLLKLRYSELKPGGHLVLHLLESSHPTRSVFHPLVEVAEEMKAAGLIPDGYLENFPMPLACDSAEADLATIRSLEEKYEIVESKAVTNEFHIYQQYRETGDLESYAKGFAEFTRAYLYPYLKGICTKGEEGEALIQLFFSKIEDNIRSQPQLINISNCYFHLKKPLN
jgi:hypothetical protein